MPVISIGVHVLYTREFLSPVVQGSATAYSPQCEISDDQVAFLRTAGAFRIRIRALVVGPQGNGRCRIARSPYQRAASSPPSTERHPQRTSAWVLQNGRWL